jgi:hypothetical protein
MFDGLAKLAHGLRVPISEAYCGRNGAHTVVVVDVRAARALTLASSEVGKRGVGS